MDGLKLAQIPGACEGMRAAAQNHVTQTLVVYSCAWIWHWVMEI